MAVNYDKLWSLLIQKGMTRTEMAKKAGITTNTLAKMGRNESIQVEVLGKICVTLNCTLNDVIDFDGSCEKYIPIPNVDLRTLECGEEYKLLGYTHLYDFPHPISRQSIQQYLWECLENCKLTETACRELVDELARRCVAIKLPKTIEPNGNLIPHVFSNAENPEDEEFEPNAIELTQVANYVEWVIERNMLDDASMGEILQHIDDKNRLVACGVSNEYPKNLIATIFGREIDSQQERENDYLVLVDEMLGTLRANEEHIIKLVYKYGIDGTILLMHFDLPNWDTINYYINNMLLNKAIRKLRHPSRSRKLKQAIKGKRADTLISDTNAEMPNSYDMSESLAAPLDGALRLPILEVPIEELGLSVRSVMCLKKANIKTVADISLLHMEDIWKIRNLGRKSLYEIIEKMIELGVYVQNDVWDEYQKRSY